MTIKEKVEKYMEITYHAGTRSRQIASVCAVVNAELMELKEIIERMSVEIEELKGRRSGVQIT